MTILFKLLRKRAGRTIDPLHVSMTGVKMGERFVMIGCDDRALIAGLASKVGLSGVAAVAAFDDAGADRAKAVGAKIGALIEVRPIERGALSFDSDSFDMAVIDDTRGRFASLSSDDRSSCLREARRVVRAGGRIEVVEGLGGGLFGNVARPTGYEAARELIAAGFNPVRLLAERDSFRFVEGLKGAALSPSST
ncbi:MAG: class I SAM-dependent methyltransferase [Vicinamibacterales bacterium]